MQILNAIGTLVSAVILTTVTMLFVAGAIYQVSELIKRK